MPYVEHVRITANGSIVGGERWSCSLAFGLPLNAPFTMGQDDLDAFAVAALARWSTLITSAPASMSTSVSLDRIDARQINQDGMTRTLSQVSPGAAVVGSSSRTFPNQIAAVCSLRTSRPGPSGRGRIYLPCLALAVGADGKVPSVIRNALATPVGAMLNGLNSDVRSTSSQATAGLVVASGVGSGVSTYVTTARIGDVLDTQRRRRDKLVENPSVISVL